MSDYWRDTVPLRYILTPSIVSGLDITERLFKYVPNTGVYAQSNYDAKHLFK